MSWLSRRAINYQADCKDKTIPTELPNKQPQKFTNVENFYFEKLSKVIHFGKQFASYI